jgi:pilus assembly protein CpaB
MRKGALFTLVLAIGLAGLSAFMARGWILNQTAPAAPQEQVAAAVTTVVVARKAMRFGDPVTAAALDAVAWPAGAVPPGSFRTVEDIFKDGADRVVLKPIEAYEPVLATKISGSGEKATLSRLIEGSLRAVTIRVNDVVGVAGFVLPGDRVDVVVTRRPEVGEPVADIVMQNIKVLGVDQDIDEEKNKPTVAKAVTVEVTPEQAQKLALAQQVGQLTLALRNEGNAAEARATTVEVSDLTMAARRPGPVVAGSAPRGAALPAVTVVRGLEATREEVAAEPPSPRAFSAAPAKPLPLGRDQSSSSPPRTRGSRASDGAVALDSRLRGNDGK